MVLSHYNPHSRYRDRAAKRMNATLLSVVVIGASLVVGFWSGRQYAVLEISSLKTEVAGNQKREKDLQDALTKVRAEAQTAQSRYDQLQQQYLQELPQDGPMRTLVDEVRQQLSEGMSPERMAFVIRSARPPRNCTDPTTKRFVVSTPAFKGPNSTIRIGEGAVNIAANGISAKNRDGQPESWFDPAQPVNLTFTLGDGEVQKKDGKLPLQHSVVASGREYRFTLEEGEKSFIKVTFDSCEYP